MVDVKKDDVKEPVKGLTINDVETEELEAEDKDSASDIAYYEEYKRAGEAKLRRDEEDRQIEALPDLKEKVEGGRDEKELRRALAIEKQKLEQFKVAPDVRWDDRKQGERRDEEQKEHDRRDQPKLDQPKLDQPKLDQPKQDQPEKKPGLLHK